MLKDLVEKSNGKKYSIKIMYDIGCLLTKHLQVNVSHKIPDIYFHKLNFIKGHEE